MDSKTIIDQTNATLVMGVRIHDHVFGPNDTVQIYSYEGRDVIFIGEQDHWYVIMDLETGEYDEKVDDSLFNSGCTEIPVSDMLKLMSE